MKRNWNESFGEKSINRSEINSMMNDDDYEHQYTWGQYGRQHTIYSHTQ